MVSDIPAEDGKPLIFFYSVLGQYVTPHSIEFLSPLKSPDNVESESFFRIFFILSWRICGKYFKHLWETHGKYLRIYGENVE
jgi:hypothetical protein